MRRCAAAAAQKTIHIRDYCRVVVFWFSDQKRLCAAGLRPAAGIRPPSAPKPPLGLPDQPRRAPRLAAAPANAAIARRHVRLKSALFRRALGASGGRGLALPACSGSAAGPAGRRETFWVHPARGELVGAVRRREPGATGRAAAARQAGSVPVSTGLWAPRARTGRRCRPAGGSGGAAGRVGRRGGRQPDLLKNSDESTPNRIY